MTYQDYAPLVAFARELFCSSKARRSSPHDHDPFWCSVLSTGATFWVWAGALFAHENLAVMFVDGPALEGRESRCTECFACANIKARVMPGTANGVLDHEAIDERAVIVCAVSSNSENLFPSPHQ